jgi:hypothetical protein
MLIFRFTTSCRLQLRLIAYGFPKLRLTRIGLGLLINTVTIKPCLPTEVQFSLLSRYIGSRMLNSHVLVVTFTPHVVFLTLSSEDTLQCLSQAPCCCRITHYLFSHADDVPPRSRLVVHKPSRPSRCRLHNWYSSFTRRVAHFAH